MSAQDIINTKIGMAKKALNRDIDGLAQELVNDGIAISANLIVDCFKNVEKDKTFTGEEVADIVVKTIQALSSGQTPQAAPAEKAE